MPAFNFRQGNLLDRPNCNSFIKITLYSALIGLAILSFLPPAYAVKCDRVGGIGNWSGLAHRSNTANTSGGSHGLNKIVSSLPDPYWVGGTGNWSDPNHWSTSSGGSGGASVPSLSDPAIFDANSFSAPGQTVTVDILATALSIDFTGVTNSPIFVLNADLTVATDMTLVSGMTFTPNTQTVEFTGTGTLTPAGKSFYRVQKSTAGTTLYLADGDTLNSTILTIDANTTFDMTKANVNLVTLYNNGDFILEGNPALESVTITNGMDVDSGLVRYYG